jgi:hypothetical protein
MISRDSVVRMSPVKPIRGFAGLFALFFGLITAWAMATPIMQAPDEWAHLYRAESIVLGQVLVSRPGAIDPVRGDPVRIPEALVAREKASRCFQFLAKVAVSCARPPMDRQGLVDTSTPASRYPPVYYALVGWPLWFGVHGWTLYLMRIVAVALSAAFLASAGLAAVRLGGGLTATGVFVAVTPMAAWLSGMVNPNGLEIAAAVALWPNLLLWLLGKTPTLRRAGLIHSTVAASTMILTRTVAAAWVVVAVASVLVLLRREWIREQLANRRVRVAIGAVVGVLAASALWAQVSRATQVGPLTAYHFRQTHFTLAHNLGRAYDRLDILWHQAIAVFGWLDTPVSATVYHLFDAALALLIGSAAVGVFRGRWRVGVAAVLAGALTAGVTIYLAASVANRLHIGFWQGRYSLPMGVGVPVLLGFAAGAWRGRGRLAAGAVAILAGVLASAVQLGGFLQFFHRNSVGVSKPLSLHGGWQPPLGIVPWLVLLVLSMGGLVLFACWAAIRADEVDGPSAGPVPTLADAAT